MEVLEARLEVVEERQDKLDARLWGDDRWPKDVGEIGAVKGRVADLEKIAGFVTGWKGLVLFFMGVMLTLAQMTWLAIQISRSLKTGP